MNAPADIAADRLLTQQRLYQDALRLALSTTFDRADASYGSARTYLEDVTRRRLVDLADNWLVTEAHTDSGAAMIAGIAKAGGKLKPADAMQLEELVLESVSSTIDSLRLVFQRDRETVRRLWQAFALEVQLTRPRYGAGAAFHVRQGKLDRLQFRQPDRRGSMWDSGVYARALYRQHLIHTAVESTLFTMVKNGRDLAVASWGPQDNKHDFVFSASGKSTDHPGYLTIKDSLFHPNTTASVAPR